MFNTERTYKIKVKHQEKGEVELEVKRTTPEDGFKIAVAEKLSLFGHLDVHPMWANLARAIAMWDVLVMNKPEWFDVKKIYTEEDWAFLSEFLTSLEKAQTPFLRAGINPVEESSPV